MTVGWSPARPRLASPGMALALGGLVALLAAALVTLAVITRHNPLTAGGDVVAIAVPFAAVGVLVARRQPGNVIGWLMISTAVWALLGADAGFYAVFDYRLGHGWPFGPVALVAGSLTSGIVSDILTAALLALPVGIGVGILKYRLYEIDRIISRTLAYVIVTGLLVGVYAGLVLLATHVLTLWTPVAVAAATLAAAALFSPLRRRVQQMVDRRFNRARYDADKIITAFAVQLQDAIDPEAARANLLAAINRALEPAHASVWIKQP